LIETSSHNPSKEAFQLVIADFKTTREADECWFNEDHFLQDRVFTFYPRDEVYLLSSISVFYSLL